MLVREIMTNHPVTITPGSTARDAVALLAANRVTALPVLDEHGALVGVLSEGDLVRHVIREDPRAHERPVVEEDGPAVLVADVMSDRPVVVRPASDVASAVRVMVTRGFKSLPVLDDTGHLVGVLSRSDVVRAVACSDDELARQVDAHLATVGLGSWVAEVTEGAVTLTGPAGSPDRALAHLAAVTVPGVLQIRPAGTAGGTRPPELRT
jgi:CBS domain-containing protein